MTTELKTQKINAAAAQATVCCSEPNKVLIVTLSHKSAEDIHHHLTEQTDWISCSKSPPYKVHLTNGSYIRTTVLRREDFDDPYCGDAIDIVILDFRNNPADVPTLQAFLETSSQNNHNFKIFTL